MAQGERLKVARERAKLTQGQAAEYAPVSQPYLSELENSKRWPNTWALLTRLANLYGCSADFLLSLTDDPRQLLSANDLADALDDAPVPVPEIQELLRFAAKMDEEALYALLIVAEALAERGDPSPAALERRLKRQERGDH